MIIDTRGEVHCVRVEAWAAVAKRQGRQARLGEQAAVGEREWSEDARGEIVCVDRAVSLVADEQVAAEEAEVGRGDGKAPGGVDRTVGGDPANEVPGRIILVDVSTPTLQRARCSSSPRR